MNKTKVAHAKKRHLSRRSAASVFSRAMKKRIYRANARGKLNARGPSVRTPRSATPPPRLQRAGSTPSWSAAKSLTDGSRQNSSRIKPRGSRARLHPHRRELDHVTQRYADLYDLAPTGYVSFDRSGRIEEINLTAAQLFGIPRERLIGMPFMVFVSREDTALFLHHLLRCRCSETRVETELQLKDVGREIIHAYLSSTPVAASMHNGALLYQTAIVDLTERKRAEEARAEAVRRQAALYELSHTHQEAKTLDEVYEAALDGIIGVLQCDRASILLYDEQQVMRFVAWRGLSKKYREAVEGHSPWKPNAKNPEPVSITDVDLANIPKPLKSTVRNEGIRGIAFIPLISSRKLIGKFMVYYNAPHLFTDDELKLATTIASQLAQMIEHRRDEDALRESEERLRAIVDQANAGMVRYSLKGRIQFVNPRFCKMLGYKESELIGKSVREITHPDDLQKTSQAFQRVMKKREASEIEKRYVRKNGSIIWVNVCDAPQRDAAGRPKFVVAVVVDITARQRAEAALRRSKVALEELVQRRTKELHLAIAELKSEIERRKGLEGEILAVSDREQQRLGQELHDGLCQHLTAVAFMARSVALRLRNHRVIDVADIEKIAELVNSAATDTRNLSTALHRADIDSAGFITALEDLVDREIWKIPCRLEVKPSFHIDDDATAAQLYRIAREAVINANKHAQAREIAVKLERSRKGMALHVIDDGVGLSDDPKLKKGLGLHIMNYRAQLAGARLEIDSPKTGGTRVSCYLSDNTRRPPKSREQENVAQRRFHAGLAKLLATFI
jgi:PAS domain S-box-containing protein